MCSPLWLQSRKVVFFNPDKIFFFYWVGPSSEYLRLFRLRSDHFCVLEVDNAMCHYRIQSYIWSGARRENLLQFFGPSSLPRLCIPFLCCCCCCIVALSLLWAERPRGRTPFSWSSHTFTALTDITHTCTHAHTHTHTQTSRYTHIPVLYPIMHCNAVHRTHAHTLIQTPVHSSVAHSPRPASSGRL